MVGSKLKSSIYIFYKQSADHASSLDIEGWLGGGGGDSNRYKNTTVYGAGNK